MKTVVVDKKDYTVFYDQHLNYTFIHCDVHSKWSKTVKEHLTKDFKQLLKLRQSPLFAIHEIGDHKHLKFLGQFGFEFYQEVIGADGKLREVYMIGNNYGS